MIRKPHRAGAGVKGVGHFGYGNFFLGPVPPKQEVAPTENMVFTLPYTSSSAVLPLGSLSDDLRQEYFSDGLTKEIINGLSKVPSLFVVVRNSTFTNKGKPVMIRQVAEELGYDTCWKAVSSRPETRLKGRKEVVIPN